MTNAARAIPAPIYAPFQCRATGCHRPATQAHHITYHPRVPDPWSKVGLCADHHEQLHALFEPVRDDIPLVVFSFQYLDDPGRIERWATSEERLAAPPVVKAPVHARQLSFGDLFGPGGEYWRQLDANEQP